MRVVHIITKLELGGAQQNTLYTVSHLDRTKFEPHLICGSGGILDNEARALKDVAVHFASSLEREIRPLTDYHAFHELKDLLIKLRADIVHTHSSKAGVLGRMAASAAGVPIIIHTYHGFGFHRFQNPIVFQMYVAAEKSASRHASHLVFVSEANWKWAKELGLIGECSASLIRSGVPVEPLSNVKKDPALKKELCGTDECKLVGMIACLKPQKDPLIFVEAADRVTQKIPSARFVLIGEGELGEAVLKRVAQMRHPDRFLLLGWRRDIPGILANLDLAVLTSLWEGLPRVIPEATISGVPTVASDIDGNREVIFDGLNGTLAKPKDPDDFAQKIIQALEEGWQVDADIAKRIRNEFDIDKMVTAQQELYLNLRDTRR
jgi:glycosyltransferase involved in cell wall biosynthesis